MYSSSASRQPARLPLSEVEASLWERSLGHRFVDDAKITDHHAIIPTGKALHLLRGKSAAAKVYALIVRRFLAAFLPPLRESLTKVVFAIKAPDAEDGEPAQPSNETEEASASAKAPSCKDSSVHRYYASGVSVEDPGWTILDPMAEKSRKPEQLPAGLANGLPAEVVDVFTTQKKTRPRPHFTEATLLSAMETAGRTLEGELADAMKGRGLGTPATRAAIIETLLKRQYLVREGKKLLSTPRGYDVVKRVAPEVRSPSMTGEWEFRLKRMEQGKDSLDAFMQDIEAYLRDVLAKAS